SWCCLLTAISISSATGAASDVDFSRATGHVRASTGSDDLQLLIRLTNLGDFDRGDSPGGIEDELVPFRRVRVVVEVERVAVSFVRQPHDPMPRERINPVPIAGGRGTLCPC